MLEESHIFSTRSTVVAQYEEGGVETPKTVNEKGFASYHNRSYKMMIIQDEQ